MASEMSNCSVADRRVSVQFVVPQPDQTPSSRSQGNGNEVMGANRHRAGQSLQSLLNDDICSSRDVRPHGHPARASAVAIT
jgi:hypothetical protein